MEDLGEEDPILLKDNLLVRSIHLILITSFPIKREDKILSLTLSLITLLLILIVINLLTLLLFNLIITILVIIIILSIIILKSNLRILKAVNFFRRLILLKPVEKDNI